MDEIEQTVLSPLIAGHVYTLLVDVGMPKNGSIFGIPGVFLFASGSGLPVNVRAVAEGPIVFGSGDWTTVKAVLTATVQNAGDIPTIVIGYGNFGDSGYVDNVRLFEDVPEPSGAALLSIGLIGIAIARQRPKRWSARRPLQGSFIAAEWSLSSTPISTPTS